MEGDRLFGLPIEESDAVPDLPAPTFAAPDFGDFKLSDIAAVDGGLADPRLFEPEIARLEQHFVDGCAPDGRPLHVVAVIEFTPGGLVGRKGLALFAPGEFAAGEARRLTARLCSQAGGLAWDVWRALL